jgi:hypothetical protein
METTINAERPAAILAVLREPLLIHNYVYNYYGVQSLGGRLSSRAA